MDHTQQRLCNKCFTPLLPGAMFCAECGTPAPQRVVGLCPNCGQEILEGQQACYSCGTLIKAVVVPVAAPPKKKKKSLSTGAWMGILAVLLVAIIAVAVVLLLQPQHAESVELEESRLELLPGQRIKLEWEVLPENTSDKSVSWQSSNTAVATVKNGEVVAVDVGVCQITVTTGNGRKDSCQVVVDDHPVEAVQLTDTELVLHVNAQAQLGAAVLPENAESTLRWASSDEAVVAVKDGTLEAKALGSCVITVTAENGVSATCQVKVEVREEEKKAMGQWELVRIEDRFENTDWPASGKTLVLNKDLTATLRDGEQTISFRWYYTQGKYSYDVSGVEGCDLMVYDLDENVLVFYLEEQNWVFEPPK